MEGLCFAVKRGGSTRDATRALWVIVEMWPPLRRTVKAVLHVGVGGRDNGGAVTSSADGLSGLPDGWRDQIDWLRGVPNAELMERRHEIGARILHI